MFTHATKLTILTTIITAAALTATTVNAAPYTPQTTHKTLRNITAEENRTAENKLQQKLILTNFNNMLQETLTHINTSEITNNTLQNIKTQIEQETALQQKLITTTPNNTLTFPHLMLTIQDMHNYATLNTEKITTLLDAYNNELTAETQRIAEAQAAAQAAENMQTQAASQPAENQNDRLQRMSIPSWNAHTCIH